MAQAQDPTPPDDDQGVTGRADHVEIDWPRSIGFFGALGAAVALDLVPVAIAGFVAAVPFLKLLNRPDASMPRRFVSHLVDGAAKPVGGDSEGTIRWAPKALRSARSRSNGRRRERSAARQKRGGGR